MESLSQIKQPTVNYSYSIDIIRSIAIIFVVIIHIYFVKTDNTFNYFFYLLVSTIVKVAVPLFIMISGALLLNKDGNISLKIFYLKRFSRIGVPIIFWPLFYYFSFILFSNKTFNISQFIYDYIFMNIYPHLYFLFIIMGLYIITPCLKSFLNSKDIRTKNIIVFTLFTYSIIITIVHYIYPTRFNYWSIFTVFIPYISYYVAGSVFVKNNLNRKKYIKSFLLYVFILLLSILFRYILNNLAISDWIKGYPLDSLSINNVLLSIISFNLLFNIYRFTSIFNKTIIIDLVKKISKASFGIYLLHPIYIYLVTKFLPIINHYLVLQFIIVFIFSYFSHILLTKIIYLKKIVG